MIRGERGQSGQLVRPMKDNSDLRLIYVPSLKEILFIKSIYCTIHIYTTTASLQSKSADLADFTPHKYVISERNPRIEVIHE
jgi:hypothetical protein